MGRPRPGPSLQRPDLGIGGAGPARPLTQSRSALRSHMLTVELRQHWPRPNCQAWLLSRSCHCSQNRFMPMTNGHKKLIIYDFALGGSPLACRSFWNNLQSPDYRHLPTRLPPASVTPTIIKHKAIFIRVSTFLIFRIGLFFDHSLFSSK